MANQWFRMYAEFATDPKVQMMSEPLQRRYVMLLCLRCNIDSNDNVTLHETLTDEAIAFQLRISNQEWLETKATFVSKNLIDEHNNPVAWGKRQYSSDSSAERVRRHREKKKQECNNGNVTVTPPEADTESDISTTTSTRGMFEKFPMEIGWRPNGDTWQAQIVSNGILESELENGVLNESIREFVSHWITEKNKQYTQSKWENKLAESIVKKRRFTEASQNGNSNQNTRQNNTGIERTANDTSWRDN